jgi:hypothetical protein
MKAHITYFIFSLFLCANSFLQAQEDNTKISISYQPQYMLILGQRVDIDVKLGNTNSWIVLGSHYYLHYPFNSKSSIEGGYEDETLYDKLDGYAFNLEHRIYLVNELLPNNIYFSYGIYYAHFDITYDD